MHKEAELIFQEICDSDGDSCKNRSKFKKPVLNSTLRLKDEIDQLQKIKDINLNEGKPCVPTKPKLTKINFGANEKIFGGLSSINVNDSILLPKAKTPFQNKYTQVGEKTPVPDLRDFLEKVPSLTYTIPEQKITLKNIEYEFDAIAYCKDFLE